MDDPTWLLQAVKDYHDYPPLWRMAVKLWRDGHTEADLHETLFRREPWCKLPLPSRLTILNHVRDIERNQAKVSTRLIMLSKAYDGDAKR